MLHCPRRQGLPGRPLQELHLGMCCKEQQAHRHRKQAHRHRSKLEPVHSKLEPVHSS